MTIWSPSRPPEAGRFPASEALGAATDAIISPFLCPPSLAYQLPGLLFSHNKPTLSNQSAVLFSQNKSAPAIGHQPNEQTDGILLEIFLYHFFRNLQNIHWGV
jgi:hypothetical protein